MSANFENKMCYFCDGCYPHHSCFISNYNDLWLCFTCEAFTLPINYNNKENGECCVCYQENPLYKLPTCHHKLCLECCKTIYFGSTKNERPIHWREMTEKCPRWPYENVDEDEDDKKQEEYYYFEDTHFNYEENTYDELIEIRNSLITDRPIWMNAEAFIHYENENFKYQIKLIKVEHDFDAYNESKTKGNKTCPLCRSRPN